MLVGRLTTAALMIAAGLFTLVLDTARDSFNLLLSIGAGTGLLYLLRWFWWRINAWSEIAAMASSFVLAAALFALGRRGVSIPSHVGLLLTIAITTAVWLATAYLTRPTDRAKRSGASTSRPGRPVPAGRPFAPRARASNRPTIPQRPSPAGSAAWRSSTARCSERDICSSGTSWPGR